MGTYSHNFEAVPLDLLQSSVAGLRRDPRSMVAMPCRLRHGGGPWQPGRLLDLSSSGFRISWLPTSSVGKQIWVKLPGLEAMPAKIRWRDFGGAGCEFDRPLNPVIVEHLLRTSGRR